MVPHIAPAILRSPAMLVRFTVNGVRTLSGIPELRRPSLKIKGGLRNSGIPESVLTPFTVKRTNIAGERKMAGAMWGTMLGYVLILLMFTGGMSPVIDRPAGEKGRKTLEAFLAAPAARREIVIGKTLAAMTAIFLTAALTLGSMVFSLKNANMGGRSVEMKQMLGTIPLDAHT